MICLFLCCVYFVVSFVQIFGWNLLFGILVLNEIYKYLLYFDNFVLKWIKGLLVGNLNKII